MSEETKKLTPAEKRRKAVEEYNKTGQLFGRPIEYKEEYPNMLIEHMRQGYSFRSFAGVIGVGFETIYRWAEEHLEFCDARKAGESAQLIYDEKLLDQLTKGEHGRSANSATHIFKMKNCHKWSDKVEIEQTTREIKIEIDKDDSGL